MRAETAHRVTDESNECRITPKNYVLLIHSVRSSLFRSSFDSLYPSHFYKRIFMDNVPARKGSEPLCQGKWNPTWGKRTKQGLHGLCRTSTIGVKNKNKQIDFEPRTSTSCTLYLSYKRTAANALRYLLNYILFWISTSPIECF